jgi:hypothetical protein
MSQPAAVDDGIPGFLKRTPAEATAAPQRKSWRDVLPVHPAAKLFDPNDTPELTKDVEKYGVQVEIVLWKDQKHFPIQLLDGRSRLDALERAGSRSRSSRSAARAIRLSGFGVEPRAALLSK